MSLRNEMVEILRSLIQIEWVEWHISTPCVSDNSSWQAFFSARRVAKRCSFPSQNLSLHHNVSHIPFPSSYGVLTVHNERNVIQLTSWWRFELWKGTTHPSSTFRTKRKAYKLLWSDSHRGGVRYSIHSIRVRIWEISPIILFRFIRLGIWREYGGCLQNSLRQHDVNQLVEKDEDIKPFDSNSWAQQLNLQWEKHFEQREPPTEDKVIQVDIGDQTHPKLISIRKILSPGEKKNLISLIWDYIDVFA